MIADRAWQNRVMKLTSNCLVLIAGLCAAGAGAFDGPFDGAYTQQPEHPRHRLAHWYADESMRQNEQARRMMCGFTGQRWALDYDLHYRWALRANPRRAYREIEERDRHLNRCRRNKLDQRRELPPSGPG